MSFESEDFEAGISHKNGVKSCKKSAEVFGQ
jgi:hypothetical protein